MFVVSMKTTRTRILAAAAVSLLLLLTVLLLARVQAVRPTQAAVAADRGGRAAFLQQLGYEILPDSEQVQEIRLPADSDPAFGAYNGLQLENGQDLTAYAGCRVKCWSYRVINYPGEAAVTARLCVYKNTIIGGDVSSDEAGGFSHGLQPLSPDLSPER